ncbi:MAG TPA: FKBP-type peptidyl-prolyl cis-trans isomerase [Pelobium sp.]
MIKKILSLSLIAILALAACKKETRTLKEIEDETIKSYIKSNNLTGFLPETLAYNNNGVTDSAVFYYKILSEGSGDALVGCPGPDYVGVFQTTTSINKNVNFEFSKYNPQFNYLCLIKPDSWRESLLKIKRGGEVRVITPSYLAYGKSGSGSTIPGNAILDSKLSLVDNKDRPAYEDNLINSYLTENNLTATKDANGIYYNIVTPGSGAAITSTAASIKVAYKGNLLTGSVFDQATNASPLTINLNNTIKGWQLDLPLIKVGGKIKLYIPSRYAYGANPPAGIPANSILAFEIELIDVTN